MAIWLATASHGPTASWRMEQGMSDDRPNRARVVEMVARRRESLGLQPPLGSVLGTKPLLGVNDDDYSGLGDALDAQQPDSQEFATLEHNAQIRSCAG